MTYLGFKDIDYPWKCKQFLPLQFICWFSNAINIGAPFEQFQRGRAH